MKGLEFLLKAAASVAISLGSLVNAGRAEVVPQMITFSSPEKIKKTAISQGWIAWQDANDIWYAGRSDPNTQYQLTTSGNAHHPDIDGDNLVYDENGIIISHNLITKIKRYLYCPTSYEICSQPKINGNGVVFHVANSSSAEPEEEIWAYLIRERRVRPITNSGNPKGLPDIYWPWAVWPELVNKENSRLGLVGGDWDIRGCDLTTFMEFVVNNDPNFSSDSCVIFGEKVLYSLNTLPQEQCGKTFLGAYYILRDKYRISFEEPTGEIHNLALHGDVLAWERIYERRNIPDSIEAMVIREGISPGFGIFESGSIQHSPDIVSDSNDPYKGAVSFVRNDVNTPQEFIITTGEETRVLLPSQEKSVLFTGGIIYDQRTGFFGLLREHWLERGDPNSHPYDFNGDEIFNFKDYATLIQ